MAEASPLSPMATILKLLSTPLSELPVILKTPISKLPVVLNTPPRQRRAFAKSRNRQVRSAVVASKTRQFVLEGTLSAGKATKYSINGEDIVISKGTWVFGELVPGARATVHGQIRQGGERHVARIVINEMGSD